MSCRARWPVARLVGRHTSDLILEGSPVPILLVHAADPSLPETNPSMLMRAEGA